MPVVREADQLASLLLLKKLPLKVTILHGAWNVTAKAILKANNCNWCILSKKPVTLKILIFDDGYRAYLVKYNWRGYFDKEIVLAKNRRHLVSKLAAILAKKFGFSPYYIRQNLKNYTSYDITNKEG